MRVAIIIAVIILAAVALTGLYACLVMSGKCSREEEREDGK